MQSLSTTLLEIFSNSCKENISMAGNDSNMSSDWHLNVNNITNTSIEMITMSNSSPMVDSFCPPIWDHSCNMNAMLREGILVPTAPMMVPPSLPPFPADSAFIERAARFSCFNGGDLNEMVNPFSSPCMGPMHHHVDDGSKPFKNEKKNERSVQSQDETKNGVDGSDNNQSDEGDFSGREEISDKGLCLNKRKKTKHNENNEETAKDSDEKQTFDQNPSKEDFIHVRARRGQATNSHSLAERVRREKISERMKFLQDIVPGCSKVTGKAVMLDEIINYVQSLQQQVEFLSMKLATVNPQSDFNMETCLAKDILQAKAGFPSSPAFPPEITMPYMGNSSEMFHRPMNIQSTFLCGGFRQPNSQAPSVWTDELHNIVHNGFNSKAEL